MRVVCVPASLALLPEYASIEDPIAGLRTAVDEAVAWLLADGSAAAFTGTAASGRVARHLLASDGDGPGRLVVANGSARRTEKAPGHFDSRAEEFDRSVGSALATGDVSALAAVDRTLAAELLADVDALVRLGTEVSAPDQVQVDYDDAPHGVQYWVVRWEVGT